MQEQHDVGPGAQGSAAAAGGVLDLRHGLEDRPGTGPAAVYGLQHVLIMFPAMITSPLVIGQQLDLPAELRATLISGVILGCGLGTLISTLGVGFVGARLPLLLGAYAVYIGPVVAIAKASSLAAATAAMLAGGVMLLLLSPVIGRLRPLFPPVVVGTLLLVTGLSLSRIATTVAFAVNTPFFGQPVTVAFVVASMVLIAVIATVFSPVVKSLSVLITVVAVYAAALALGLADTAAVAAAPWFRVPALLPYGIDWPDPAGLTTILIYHVVAAVYTMSIAMALCTMLGAEPSGRRLRGAVAGDGVGSMIAVVFGGTSLISYDQNVGAISLTGVGSRFVVAAAGAILVAMALVPKFAAAVGAIPPFLLGGTLLFMFAMIAVVGVRVLAPRIASEREALVVVVAVGVSMAVNYAPAAVFAMFPPALRIIAGDGIVVGTVAAVVLNLVLPGRKTA